MNSINKVMVRFTRGCSPYQTGERASFTHDKAKALVASGSAVYEDIDNSGTYANRQLTTDSPRPEEVRNKENPDADSQSNDENGSGDKPKGKSKGKSTKGRKKKRQRLEE